MRLQQLHTHATLSRLYVWPSITRIENICDHRLQYNDLTTIYVCMCESAEAPRELNTQAACLIHATDAT